MHNEPPQPPPGWQMEVFEVIPGLMIGTKLVPPAEYASIGVDVIVDLEDWEFAWAPPVPTGSMYLSFPLQDDESLDPKIRHVAVFVASLVRSGARVLVHCTEGLNRSGVIVARALLELGWSSGDAIELIRRQRGVTRDGFHALSNERFVAWLLTEDLPEGDPEPESGSD